MISGITNQDAELNAEWIQVISICEEKLRNSLIILAVLCKYYKNKFYLSISTLIFNEYFCVLEFENTLFKLFSFFRISFKVALR